MNRRAFLSSLIGGVAATAAVRTWPFRVFSFPSEIKPAYRFLTMEEISRQNLTVLNSSLEAQYKSGVLAHGWGFDWFMEPEKVYTFMVDRELEMLNSKIDDWNREPLRICFPE